MKTKVGIFFGGPSREREISFAGGRTVFDNLNKSIFEPVPIFVDSDRNFILLDWKYIYKGTIRDFYPPVEELPPSTHAFQVYLESLGKLSEDKLHTTISRVGQRLMPEDLSHHIQIAFLALHGEYGEDGQIQAELEELGIPYTGSGVKASQVGMDKALQKGLMAEKGFDTPPITIVERNAWIAGKPSTWYAQAVKEIGLPLVVRPARQGSSIGVRILDGKSNEEDFAEAVNQAFFREWLSLTDWASRSEYDRVDHVRLLTDIRDGLGFPMDARYGDQVKTIYHPEALLETLDGWASEAEGQEGAGVWLASHHGEEKVLLEGFIRGVEFSCIVLRQEDGSAVALPPTEIVKGGDVYDYRSKYMPGRSRKRTPIDLPEASIDAIRSECERLFRDLDFQVYARIDGFFTPEGKIFLNDPNTTSGMLPSSFFFHQAAEIGLNPSEFLTYILRLSLQERLAAHPQKKAWANLLKSLDEQIAAMRKEAVDKTRIGIVLGGYSFERHISVESGRNIYEKLASSAKYQPIPLFLSRVQGQIVLHRLPINLLLKDNADDIRDKIGRYGKHPIVEKIKEQCAAITAKYADPDVIFEPESWSFDVLAKEVDGVFIALHGRPGEDGELQGILEEKDLPYNGSGPESSALTIDKFRTLQTLRKDGFTVTEQMLLSAADHRSAPEGSLKQVESLFGYPLIAKPVDDGCSSAVQVIQNREQLTAYLSLLFGEAGDRESEVRKTLHLRAREEFPIKQQVLFEKLIRAEGASHFLEITGGMLTHLEADGSLRYEVFEPSEALATGEVLSLEEKFLAGEGQNLTPARFDTRGASYAQVSAQVKETLERAARLLGVEGYCRIDAFVRIYEGNQAETIIIEVNSLPGMTPATAIFHQAAINGYTPYEFIDRILTFAFARQKRRVPPVAASAAATPATTEPKPKQTNAMDQPKSAQATSGKKLADRLREWGRKAWRETISFLRSPIFLRNLLAFIAFCAALMFFVWWGLRLYTNHGKSYQVHNYVGLEIEDARKLAANRNFNIEVSDSVWLPNRPPGVVFSQNPAPLSRVKKNRTIYLVATTVSVPEVPLPDPKSASYDLRTYENKLRANQIKLRIRKRVFSQREQPGTILNVYYEGELVEPGAFDRGFRVPKGSTVEVDVTKRMGGEVAVPNTVCMKYEEARFVIENSGLSLDAVYGDISSLDSAYVQRQEPAFAEGRNLPVGSQVSLYIVQGKPGNCDGTVYDLNN